MNLSIKSDNQVLQEYNAETQELLREYKERNGKLLSAVQKRAEAHFHGVFGGRIGDKRMQEFLKGELLDK